MSLPGVSRRAVWLVVVALVALVGGVTAFAVRRDDRPPPGPNTVAVKRGTVTVAVSAAGTVQSSQTRGLSFAQAGTVTEVDVKPGDSVAVGRVLARIDPTDAQASVDSAQTRVTNAADALTRAQATAARPTCPSAAPRTGGSPGAGGPGGGVPSGGVPSGGVPGGHRTPTPTPAPSRGPTPTPTSTPTPSTSPSRSLGSPAIDVPAGLVAVAPVAVVAVAPAPLGAAPAATPTCNPAGRAATSTADPLLSAQQQLNQAQLALSQAQAKLAGTVLTATVAGRVLAVAGKVGAVAAPGGTGFVVLGDVVALAVTGQFSEADVGQITVGQVAAITLPNHPDPFPGTVSEVDPAGTVSGRLVRYGVVIAFTHPPADLLLGQSATVSVTTATASNVLYVSSFAVTGVAGTTGTVTVRTGGRDVARTVTVGLRGDQFTEVVSGLSVDDEVVLPSGRS